MAGLDPGIFDAPKVEALKGFADSVTNERFRRDGIRALLFCITTQLNTIGASSYRLAKLTTHDNWPKSFGSLTDGQIDGFARNFHTPEESAFYASVLLIISILDHVNHTCFDYYLTKATFEAADSIFAFEDILRLPSLPGGTTAVEGQSPATKKISRIRSRGLSLCRFLMLPSAPDISQLLKSPLFAKLQAAENDDQLDQLSIASLRPYYHGESLRAFELRLTLLRSADGKSEILYVRTYDRAGQSQSDFIADGIVVEQNTIVYFIQTHAQGGGLLISAVPIGQFQATGLRFRRGLALSTDMGGNLEALASPIVFYKPAGDDTGGLPQLLGDVTEAEFTTAFASSDPKAAKEIGDFLRNLGNKVIWTPHLSKDHPAEPLFSWGEVKAYIERVGQMREFDAKKHVRIGGISEEPLRVS